MGVHQDKDERRETLDAGVPIVSVSLGDTARFVVGGLTRKEPTRPLMLHSGDVRGDGRPVAAAFSRRDADPPGRRRGTGPGRFNLTFREWSEFCVRGPRFPRSDCVGSGLRTRGSELGLGLGAQRHSPQSRLGPRPTGPRTTASGRAIAIQNGECHDRMDAGGAPRGIESGEAGDQDMIACRRRRSEMDLAGSPGQSRSLAKRPSRSAPPRPTAIPMLAESCGLVMTILTTEPLSRSECRRQAEPLRFAETAYARTPLPPAQASTSAARPSAVASRAISRLVTSDSRVDRSRSPRGSGPYAS